MCRSLKRSQRRFGLVDGVSLVRLACLRILGELLQNSRTEASDWVDEIQ